MLMLMLNKYADGYSTELKLKRIVISHKRKVRFKPNEDTLEQEPPHFTYLLYCIVFVQSINFRLHD